MSQESAVGGTVVATVVVLSVVAGGALGSAGTEAGTAVGTLGHGAENGNYTVDLPFATDHYPRSENPGGEHNGSINHFAGGTQELFDDVGASDGIEQMSFIVIQNGDVDFSECTTSNTAAFGIDRDSDDPGTTTDADLLSYMEANQFNDHSIVVNFYEGDELGAAPRDDEGGKETGREDGDPNPELYPDDQIVAHQGYQSGGGACYGMPEQAGWYQIDGMANGTSFSGNQVEINLVSHYFYICECDSEREAYETLGPPPGQSNPYASGGGGDDASGGSTPVPTEQSTSGPTPAPSDQSGDDGSGSGESTPARTATAAATATPAPTSTPAPAGGGSGATATATPAGSDGQSTATSAASPQATRTAAADGGTGDQQSLGVQQAGVVTPTAGAGPGFGVLATLGGLLALGLLARRR